MLAFGAAAVLFVVAAPSAAQDAAAEAAIRSIVAEQAGAWDAGNGSRYAARLAPDASFDEGANDPGNHQFTSTAATDASRIRRAERGLPA